ncbi:MAG: flagellar biosynthetic protein FliR [Candidatus Saganbacteria bacterium]|nr:flagellar biosynthetic protein FliR [Candidatus Saganbacteria bacterium]
MVLTLPQIEVFMFVFARITGIFLIAPVFSTRTFPILGKISLIIWMAVVLWFVVPVSPGIPSGPIGISLFLIKELIIGLIIGFSCHILFAAIQSAGDIIDLQMGMSIATALDPTTGTVTSIVGKLTFYIALTVFLILNGHHMLLSAIHQSFRTIPVGAPIIISQDLVLQMINLGSNMLLIAVQLASPALLLIFISDFSFGIVSRVAPQVNVFMLGFQVKPTLGLLAILFSLPLMITNISSIITQMTQEIIRSFSIMKL